MAINAVSDALTGDGSSETFTGDNDPELVGDAIPFAIKLYESLLAQNPNHHGLILTTGSLFVMYANAFIQGPAQMLSVSQYQEQINAYTRARKLYLRGANILYSGLDKKYPGFTAAYQNSSLDTVLPNIKKADVPLLYWAASGILGAYSLDPLGAYPLDPRDVTVDVKLPECRAMLERGYSLDPDFNKGAIDDMYILLYASLPENMGGDKSLAKEHFQRSIEKSGGMLASPYVSYAQSICIPAQDYDTFKEKLEQALAIDPNADMANRLVNIVNQRKARYLLDNASSFFVELDNGEWDEFEDWEDYDE
jgi:predicted anti-sigma-YlaC factor YlaD